MAETADHPVDHPDLLVWPTAEAGNKAVLGRPIEGVGEHF